MSSCNSTVSEIILAVAISNLLCLLPVVMVFVDMIDKNGKKRVTGGNASMVYCSTSANIPHQCISMYIPNMYIFTRNKSCFYLVNSFHVHDELSESTVAPTVCDVANATIRSLLVEFDDGPVPKLSILFAKDDSNSC